MTGAVINFDSGFTATNPGWYHPEWSAALLGGAPTLHRPCDEPGQPPEAATIGLMTAVGAQLRVLP